MSIMPNNRPTLTLQGGKYFRNVMGSTTSAGIGHGDPYPANITNWLKYFERYTGKTIKDDYYCPACGHTFRRSQLKGAHIVLGKTSDGGMADSMFDLSSAAECFRPIDLIDVNTMDFTYNGTLDVVDSNRVFIIPLCTNCNNQRGYADIAMRGSQEIAHLICYGYTDDYVKYMNLYETDFFAENDIEGDDDEENEYYQNLFENSISRKVAATVANWQTAYQTLDPFDASYLTASQPSQAAVPAPPALSTGSMTTRSGHSYY